MGEWFCKINRIRSPSYPQSQRKLGTCQSTTLAKAEKAQDCIRLEQWKQNEPDRPVKWRLLNLIFSEVKFKSPLSRLLCPTPQPLQCQWPLAASSAGKERHSPARWTHDRQHGGHCGSYSAWNLGLRLKAHSGPTTKHSYNSDRSFRSATHALY